MMGKGHFNVVVGTSAGGIGALENFLSFLPADLPIAIFIVVHLSRTSVARTLLQRLQRNTPYKCVLAEDNRLIRKGVVHLAPANAHLLIKDNKTILGTGPPENRWRPSIDVLFRSAAASGSQKVIGIILTGMLDDGLAGMQAIKKCGGITMVQNPDEAPYPEMPENIIRNVPTDHILILQEMGQVISQITRSKKVMSKQRKIPLSIKLEADLAERVYTEIPRLEQLGGERSFVSCPACGGALWEIKKDNVNSYRCHVGHAFNEGTLMHSLQESTEASLWMALRILEERRNLLLKMAGEQRRANILSRHYAERAEEMKHHIEQLKKVLFDTQQSGE
jgi:two-component system, chemotaxis family, protein-glutamate methylesterase/glutaminase